jgi:hypothetical protein
MKECDNSKIHISSNFILSISLLIMYSDFRTDLGILKQICVISGFRHEVEGNCAVVDCYTASSDNFSTFRYNLSVPILRVPQSKRIRNQYYSLCNNPEKRRSDLKPFWSPCYSVLSLPWAW